jgi:CheY-like chemotaxis protein
MEVTRQAASSTGASDLERLTILIADDDQLLVESLGELLELEGYKVAVAADGQEALEHLRRGLRPCVILLDLVMPGMNGWDFRQQQLKDDELKDIPVVVVSATAVSSQSVKAQFGDIEFVQKPPSHKKLLEAIRRRCGLS